MTQYEQENDLGRGGGEVDEETMDKAWATAAERRGPRTIEDEVVDEDEDKAEAEGEGAQPWAKFSSGRRADEDES